MQKGFFAFYSKKSRFLISLNPLSLSGMNLASPNLKNDLNKRGIR